MWRLFLAVIMATVGGDAWADDFIPLGAPDFRPSMERPFGWRGDGTGRFPGATPVTDWSETENVRWSANVGSSYSSPVLAEQFVFVLSEPGLLVCLRRADGALRWKLALTPDGLADPDVRKVVADYKPPKDGSGFAAATPVTDGRNVYVLLANGLLCAVDFEGHRLWSAGITAPPGTGYGRSASPIIAGDYFMIISDQGFGNCFEASSGKFAAL